MTKEGPNKRRSSRIAVNFDIIYKLKSLPEVHMKVDESERYALMLDISEQGMAIETDYQVPELSELEITLHLIFKDRQTDPMHVVGGVRYNLYLADRKKYRLGIKFLQIDDDIKQEILDFIKYVFSK